MQCPSCNQEATSFWRNAFSLQGVSVFKSAHGYLTCQNCGTLLRVTGYGKRFWFFYIPTVVVLILFILFYRALFEILGIDAGLVWVVLLFLIFTAFIFLIWKKPQLEKVDEDIEPANNSST
jgi:hypothetical protein